VLKNSHIITFDLLFYLEDVNALWEFLNLAPADCVDKTSLANTIATNKTVLVATGQLECCAI